MEEQKFYNLTKTQETKRKRKKFPNVFFKKELIAVFSRIEEPKIIMGAFLAFFCALRISEVCKIKWIDIDLENKRLKVVDGKCHKDGFVPISSICIPVLQKWKAMNSKEEYFLPNDDHNKPHICSSYLFKCFKLALTKAGMNAPVDKNVLGRNQYQYKFHTLRHSRCTHLLSNGIPIQKVQHFMRHDKIETTLTYTWILDAELNSMVEQVDGVWKGDEVVKHEQNNSFQKQEDAIDVLRKRLAYGEISVREYQKLAEALAR
jgi:integrase